MRGRYGADRLARAKLLAAGLLDQLRGERVAVIAFAGAPALLSPLTTDYEYARRQVEEASAGSVARGGTNIAGALLLADEIAFDNVRRGWKQIVVLSDGGDRSAAAEVEARLLEGKGIHLASIGIGTASGATVPASETDPTPFLFDRRPVWTGLNRLALLALSPAYWNGSELRIDALYKEMAASTPPADPAIETELYPYFLCAAALLLALEWIPRPVARPALARAFAASFALAAWQPNLPPGPPPTVSSDEPSSTPQTAEEWVARGRWAMQNRDYKAAVQDFEAAREMAKNSPEIEFDEAQAAYKAGNFGGALNIFEEAATRARTDAQRARCLLGQGNAEYRTAMETISGRLAQSLAAQTMQQAASLYAQALKLDPGLEDARYNLDVARRKLLEVEQPLASQRPPELRGREDSAGGDAESVLKESEKGRPKHRTEAVNADW